MSDEVKLTWGKTENDLLQRWPKSADGTPEEPALLTVAMDTNAETDMLCAMLRSYDIPVLRKYEGEGSFGKIVLGTPGSGTWLSRRENPAHHALREGVRDSTVSD